MHHQRSISHQSHAYYNYNTPTSPYLHNTQKQSIHNRIKWTVHGLDDDSDSKDVDGYGYNMDQDDYGKTKRSIKYSTYSESDDEDSFKSLNYTDDDKEVEENSYCRNNRKRRDSNATTVTFIDNSSQSESRSIIHEEKERNSIDAIEADPDDADAADGDENVNENVNEISTIYNLRPFEFGVLLSEQFEAQMRRYRLYTLLKVSEFKLHIFPEGLLKDIINVIVG